MKLTDLIQTGVSNRSQRVVIYGSNGIGKSTLAAGFPGPVFVDTEDGTSHLDVHRIPVKNYDTLCKALEELRKCELPCETIVIDTIDRVELFLREIVCKEHRISGMEGLPYGKAYHFLIEKFNEFLTKYLDALIFEGIHVVVVGHTNIKRVQFPGMDAFDRWELRLHTGCANRLKEWSDHVLFLNWEMRVIENEGKPKGVGGKERVIFTNHSAAHDAKVRVPIGEKVPCTFNAIAPLLRGWQRPAKVSVQQLLAYALADIDPKQVIAFLIDRKQIRNDQEIVDVSSEYAREALRRIAEFKQTVTDFDFIAM